MTSLKVKEETKTPKKAIITAVLVAVVIVVTIIGIWRLTASNTGSGDGNIVYVNSVESIMNPDKAGGMFNRFAGVVESQKEMNIQTNSEKTVKEIYVQEGDEVSVGTKLFCYDIAQDESTLERANLELERIDNSIANKRDEITQLQKEKASASNDMQLDYTIQIQNAQMELKQTEYEKQSKEIEIEKLKNSIENADVVSEMDGIVKSINDNTSGEGVDYYNESNAFMTIIAVGNYRIKGKVNEQNLGSVTPGQPVIVHSRVDEEQTWKGVMGEVDMENPGNDSNGMYYYGGDSMTQSNSYPFYVELEDSEGLILGQHVYIEPDYGQQEEKAGIWLDDYYICDVDTEPYVWADNGRGKLEKRKVVLGEHDDALFRYEIIEGLTEADSITYPEDMLEEGMNTADGLGMQSGFSGEAEDMGNDLNMEDSPDMNGDANVDMNGDANVDMSGEKIPESSEE